MNPHERWMARALELAARGLRTTFPNPRVGCVVVRDGEIAGEGWHERAGEPHAEVHALRAAGERARGADLYVSLEPCAHQGRTPPCADAVVASGVRKVYVAMQDPNPQVSGRGLERLRVAGIVVESGLLAEEAAALNRGFILRMTRGRPYVTLKLAASLDGRTAMASGESQWITGEEARKDVHRLRAEAGAVLCSSATVLADDPQLSVRLLGETITRQPDRIVLDSAARVPPDAKVWMAGARRMWITSDPGPAPESVERIAVGADSRGGVGLPAALAALGAAEINEVLVECGPRLAGALLQAGLVDRLVIYLAPSLLGDSARPLAVFPGVERLAQCLRLRYTDARQIGDDLRITSEPELK